MAKHPTTERERRRYATLTEAGEYAGGLGPRTVRRMIARGELTGYRLGPRVIRIDLNELDAAMRPIPTGGSDAT